MNQWLKASFIPDQQVLGSGAGSEYGSSRTTCPRSFPSGPACVYVPACSSDAQSHSEQGSPLQGEVQGSIPTRYACLSNALKNTFQASVLYLSIFYLGGGLLLTNIVLLTPLHFYALRSSFFSFLKKMRLRVCHRRNPKPLNRS